MIKIEKTDKDSFGYCNVFFNVSNDELKANDIEILFKGKKITGIKNIEIELYYGENKVVGEMFCGLLSGD